MPFISRPSKKTPRAVVEKADPGLEAAMAKAFLEAVKQFRDGVGTMRVADAIRQSVEAALRALPTGAFIGDLRPLVDAIVREVVKAGRSEATTIAQQGRGFRLSFDVSDPRALEWARTRAGELVRGVTDEVEQAIKDAVTQALDGNISVTEAQRRIRRTVGLHDRWQRAVDNTYARLVKQNLASGMTEEQARAAAQSASEKYQDRLVRARAKNIARTEVATAQNEGRWAAWQQAGEAGYVNLATSMKEWRTAPEFVSSRTVVCPICAPLDGKRIPVDQNFQTGLRSQPDGIKMPPAHPACRCRAVLVPLDFKEIERRLQEAKRQEAAR